MPFEYLLAREGNPGALLLSEFSSVARVLSGAVTTNPFSIKKVGLAIETALSLPPDERARRAAADLASTRLDSTSAWARRVLLDVTRAARPAGAEGRGSAAGMGLGLGWRAAGSGTGQLATGMAHAASCCALRRDHLLTTYRATSRRLILLADAGVLRPSPAAADGHADAAGADGLPDPPTPPGRSPRPPGLSPSLDTLPRLPLLPPSEAESALGDAPPGPAPTPPSAGGASDSSLEAYQRSLDLALARGSSMTPSDDGENSSHNGGRDSPTSPSAAVRSALRVICADPRNTVAVLTSGSREAAAAAYGGVGGCSLVSDGGLHLAWAPSPQKPAEVGWELTAAAQAAPDDGWQELALSICEAYAQRTNGAAAYADAATGAVRFDFGLADVEFGAMQARELNNHLADALGGHVLDVDLGANSLVVRPRGVDQGGAARQLLALCSAGARRPIDFVLALGVGGADEPMFTAVEEWRAALPRGNSLDVGGPHGHACVVGRTPSKAAQFVEDQPSAAALLDALKWGSMRASKSFSFDAGGGEAPLDGGGGAHDGGGVGTLPARPCRLSDSPNLGSGIPETAPADIVAAANGGANGDAATERRPLARAADGGLAPRSRAPMSAASSASSLGSNKILGGRAKSPSPPPAAAPSTAEAEAAAAAASAASAASAALVAALRTQVEALQRELAARPSYGAPADGGGPSAPPPWATAPAAPVQREAGRPPVQAGLVVGRPRRRRPRAPRARRRAPPPGALRGRGRRVGAPRRRGAAGRTRAGRALLLALLQGAALAAAARAPDSVAGVKLG